jgi:hypothetical protein
MSVPALTSPGVPCDGEEMVCRGDLVIPARYEQRHLGVLVEEPSLRVEVLQAFRNKRGEPN